MNLQRPFALKGRFYANIFIHFEPTGEPLYDGEWDEIDNFFPPYIKEDSPALENWARQNPGGWRKNSPSAAQVARPEGHAAAAAGDVGFLKELAVGNERALHLMDENGWQPLHEAVRGGHIDAVRILVAHGADVNAVTNGGSGVSPYHIARRSLPESHPVTTFLAQLGGVDVGPDL